jgi:hypothetical protein
MSPIGDDRNHASRWRTDPFGCSRADSRGRFRAVRPKRALQSGEGYRATRATPSSPICFSPWPTARKRTLPASAYASAARFVILKASDAPSAVGARVGVSTEYR